MEIKTKGETAQKHTLLTIDNINLTFDGMFLLQSMVFSLTANCHCIEEVKWVTHCTIQVDWIYRVTGAEPAKANYHIVEEVN